MTSENETPNLHGEIRMKKVAMNIIPLNTWFSIPSDKLTIEQNKLIFNKFMILDSAQKQMSIDGKVDLADLTDVDKMTVDLKVTSDMLQVMNTTVKDNPELFGSIIINSGLDITGAIKSPAIKGNIVLEKGTNITYRQVQDISVKGSQK